MMNLMLVLMRLVFDLIVFDVGIGVLLVVEYLSSPASVGIGGDVFNSRVGAAYALLCSC